MDSNPTRLIREFEDIYHGGHTTVDLKVPSLAHASKSSRKMCLDYFYSETRFEILLDPNPLAVTGSLYEVQQELKRMMFCKHAEREFFMSDRVQYLIEGHYLPKVYRFG
jgi:hypothetical protein